VGVLLKRALLCVLFCLIAPRASAQQIFSPGPLAKPHASLEGLSNCMQCHAVGNEISAQHCLHCHLDIQQDMDAKSGLHGHLDAQKSACESCHREHLGRQNDLMPWRPDKSDFKHATTGFPLLGAHAKVPCMQCHTARFVSDPNVAMRQRAHPGQVPFSGLSSRCNSCHFDEHRGQEGISCQRCHNERKWIPATLFDHDDADYPLTGKHNRVACDKCHPSLHDAEPPKGPLMPVKPTYMRFKPIEHAACLNCHKDPHDGKLGLACASCHTTRGWHFIKAKVEDSNFHEKTAFPLRGEHVDVPCKSCHGPTPGHAAVFKGLAFETCQDCHYDAHLGQIGPPRKPEACERCHTVQGFVPPRFTLEMHAKTRYPLEGAHAEVPCDACHTADPALLQRVPKGLRRKLEVEHREPLFAQARFDVEVPPGRCDSCHADPHNGQFAARVAKFGCADCHVVESFKQVSFDHDKESRFPLTGAHTKVPCGQCHEDGVFKPLSTECQSCHRDVHAGQFDAPPAGKTACERCHTTKVFKPSTFDHNDPKTSPFVLTGAHEDVRCDHCHTPVKVTQAVSITRYTPLPTACEGCHKDFHEGTLASLSRSIKELPETTSEGAVPCRVCHTDTHWLPAVFAQHSRFNFPLEGGHATTPCNECHTRSFTQAVPSGCAACHRDAHAGELGAQCAGCHTARNWDAEFDVKAHRLLNFPLRGAHGSIPCQECHPGYFAKDFRGTAATCFGCHQKDYVLAGLSSMNHVASGFSTNCRTCHDPWNFQRGRLDSHDPCFTISNGVHAQVTCRECHSNLSGLVATGACNTPTATCTTCHSHNPSTSALQHRNVPGYVFNDGKCYACHTTAR
jgi:hypothetical protein